MNPTTLYKNHGKDIGYWKGWTEGPTVFVEHAAKLDGKPVVRQYDAKGKNIGRSNETTPAEQAVLEVASKARLKLDKGYVEDLAAAEAPPTNTLGLLRPMLATPMDKVKPEAIDWTTAYVQPKLDGHRALFKDGILYSRQGKALELPHITKAIVEAQLEHLHLDGELYVHGLPLQQISRLIKKYTPDSLQVAYHIYDCILDERFLLRSHALNYARVKHGHIKLVDTASVNNMDDVMAFHENFREQGYEGTMLRFSDETYRDGKRSRTLLKIKEFHDAEFKVIGYDPGKPYIKDGRTYQVPVWLCDAGNGQRFNVTAQGDMESKDDQWVNRDEHIGMMLTVKYHYLSKDGIPQLPVALRWREDV